MSETLKTNSPEQGQSDWDALTKLSMGSGTEQTPHGASYAFQQEAMTHRSNAEAFFSQASQDQKDQLKTVGIRDSQDAGEYLHEMASWNRQVERHVEGIDEAIYGNFDKGVGGMELRLIERGQWENVNPITGEDLKDSPFVPTDNRVRRWWEEHTQRRQEEPWENDNAKRYWEENFQRWQEELIEPNAIETKAVSAIIRGELQIQDSEETQEAVTPRSAEALEKESIDKWIATTSGDADKDKKLHDSVFYATLKRKIQREAEECAKTESAAV